MSLPIPLVPRSKDGILRVIITARISTPNQDPDSMEAQHEDAEKWLSRNYSGEAKVDKFADQVSGWRVDRESLREIHRLVKSGQVDVVIVNELREIIRNPEFQWRFIHQCMDNGVRLISICDGIDTATDNWETMAHVGVMKAGIYVPETRRRVRRKANYSFGKGGMVLRFRFGYQRLTKEQAASGEFGPPGLQLVKDPDCTDTIRRMRQQIIEGRSPDEVAESLNSEKVPTGPYSKAGIWTGRLVAGLLRDPILIGLRQFRRMRYTPIYETGVPRRDKNDKPEQKLWPELAHLSQAEFDDLQIALDARSNGNEQPQGSDNPLYRKPRAWSLWPGQHAKCGVCGATMHRYGKFLKCKNAVSKGLKTCWNHVQANFALIHSRILTWVIDTIGKQPNFRKSVVQAAWDMMEHERHRSTSQEVCQVRLIERLERQMENLTNAIQLGGDIPALVKKLEALQKDRDEAVRKATASTIPEDMMQFSKIEDIEARFDDAFRTLALGSHKFADILRRLLPEFVITPVMALDCPQIRPRARVSLSNRAWAIEGEPATSVSAEFNLFEEPEHIRHIEACVALRKAEPSMGLRPMAVVLGINYMTAKRALRYRRLMDEMGEPDAYRSVNEKPLTASRWKKRKRKENPDQAA